MSFLYIKHTTNIEEILPKTNFKLPHFLQMLIFFIKNLFCIFTLKDNTLILPIQDTKSISKLKWKKLSKKSYEFIIKHKVKNIALSCFLDEHSSYRSIFYNTNVQILNGRWLFPFLSFDILKYITTQTNKELAQFEVAILANNNNELINAVLLTLAKSVKLLTIVTKEPEIFNKISQNLYDDLGIIIRVSNNKRKCLQKANIILNYDFDDKSLNEYNLNSSSIIINFNKKIEILSKSFTGINANYFDFTCNDEFTSLFREKNLSLYFPNQVLLESLCLGNKNLEDFIHTFHRYGVDISALIGNNGIINKNEFVTIFSQNWLDKNI